MAYNSLADFQLSADSTTEFLPLERIELWLEQPRNHIDPDDIELLAKSLDNFEQLAPIIVRPIEGSDKYRIVAGEKRYRAAVLAQKEQIEVKIRELSDEEAYEIALVENRLRGGLNPIDDTIGTLTILEKKTFLEREEIVNYLHKIGNNKEVPSDFLNTAKEVFARVSDISIKTFAKKRLRLLNLPVFIFEAIRKGKISYPNAVMFAKIKDETTAENLLEQAIVQKWNREKIAEEVNKIHGGQKNSENKYANFSEEELSNTLRETYKKVSKVSRSPKILQDKKKRKQLEKIIEAMEKMLNSR
jgi:ParB family chromosome partitioning protein